MQISDSIMCALIGVAGTLFGTIVGFVLPYLCSGFGRKVLAISNVDVSLGTGITDCFGTSESRVTFDLAILNKKNKDLVIEKIGCVFYEGNDKILSCTCKDKDTQRNYAGGYAYDTLTFIDVPKKTSKQISACIYKCEDLTMCDKIVFTYSWGLLKREEIVWVKEDKTNANA